MVQDQPHDMTGRLALLAMVGDLVVAIEASLILQIRRAAETTTRRIEKNLYALDVDDRTIPGWDLGELLGLGTTASAWVTLELGLASEGQTFALRLGRCTSVRALPSCRALPPSVFSTRPGAFCAAFAANAISELDGAPSGVVLAPRRLMTQPELEAGKRIVRRREVGGEAALKG